MYENKNAQTKSRFFINLRRIDPEFSHFPSHT